MSVIPADLEQTAYRDPNGELAWARDDALRLIGAVAGQELAISSGEVWFVPEGARQWTALVPQRASARPGAYAWATQREAGEDWAAFVARCRTEASTSVSRMPGQDDLPDNLAGRILYNLNWLGEAEFDDLERKREAAEGSGRSADSGGAQPAKPSGGVLSRLFGRK
jgi:hypothetical protein